MNLCFFVVLHTAEIFAAQKFGWANESGERREAENLALFTTRSVTQASIFPFLHASSRQHCISSCLHCRALTDHTPLMDEIGYFDYI